MLSDSPWAMTVQATMDDPADRPENSSAALPPGVAEAGLPSNARQGATQRWDGGIGKNRMGHLATIPVTVRWDSSVLVRQALERRHDAGSAVLDGPAKTNFIITVIGLLPANQAKAEVTLHQKSSSEDAGAPVRTPEETLEWFMSNSRLFIKGQPAIQPQNVKIDTVSGAIQVFFNRSQDVVVHKRDVIFATRYGTMNVQAKFRTKDMVMNGLPDL